MEITIDTSGFTDQLTEDIFFAFYYVRYIDDDGDSSFEIERILLEDDWDGWEHYRAIRLYDFLDEESFYLCCEMCQKMNLSYEDI